MAASASAARTCGSTSPPPPPPAERASLRRGRKCPPENGNLNVKWFLAREIKMIISVPGSAASWPRCRLRRRRIRCWRWTPLCCPRARSCGTGAACRSPPGWPAPGGARRRRRASPGGSCWPAGRRSRRLRRGRRGEWGREGEGCGTGWGSPSPAAASGEGDGWSSSLSAEVLLLFSA